MADDIWTFALAFYDRPGVAEACLRCQDEAGADVTLLLFALWQAASGVSLARDAFAALDSRAKPWRENVVMPLRGVRRHLKDAGADDLRGMVKNAELAAERSLLEALGSTARHAVAPAPAGTAARANLAAYQAATGLLLPADATTALLASFDAG